MRAITVRGFGRRNAPEISDLPRCLLALALFAIACGSGPRTGTTSIPGRGAISVEVDPNPIVVQRVSGNQYAFPFDVTVRETGGRPVDVTRVSVTVFGFGGMSLGQESWDANRIRALGYGTSIPARGELRYHFAPRRDVPDERIFSSLSAELRVEAADDTGVATSASTAVTARR